MAVTLLKWLREKLHLRTVRDEVTSDPSELSLLFGSGNPMRPPHNLGDLATVTAARQLSRTASSHTCATEGCQCPQTVPRPSPQPFSFTPCDDSHAVCRPISTPPDLEPVQFAASRPPKMAAKGIKNRKAPRSNTTGPVFQVEIPSTWTSTKTAPTDAKPVPSVQCSSSVPEISGPDTKDQQVDSSREPSAMLQLCPDLLTEISDWLQEPTLSHVCASFWGVLQGRHVSVTARYMNVEAATLWLQRHEDTMASLVIRVLPGADETLKVLGPTLRRSKNLQFFHLFSYIPFGEQVSTDIVSALAVLHNLQSVYWQLLLADSGAAQALSGLHQSQSLRILRLNVTCEDGNPSRPNITGNILAEAIATLQDAPKLTTLGLVARGNHITEAGALHLCHLSKSRTIQNLWLDLSGNPIGNAGVEALRKLLDVQALRDVVLDLQATRPEYSGAPDNMKFSRRPPLCQEPILPLPDKLTTAKLDPARWVALLTTWNGKPPFKRANPTPAKLPLSSEQGTGTTTSSSSSSL